MTERLQRDTVITIIALAGAALVWRPRDLMLGLGVLGGGALAMLSYWAIRGAVESVTSGGKTREFRPVSRVFVLVKFFTRHAILALAAYGMMTRLRLDPVGMLIGVSAPVVAAAIESLRFLRK